MKSRKKLLKNKSNYRNSIIFTYIYHKSVVFYYSLPQKCGIYLYLPQKCGILPQFIIKVWYFFEKFDYPTFLSMFFIDGVKGQNQKMMKNRLKLMKNMVKLMKNMVTLKFEFFWKILLPYFS